MASPKHPDRLHPVHKLLKSGSKDSGRGWVSNDVPVGHYHMQTKSLNTPGRPDAKRSFTAGFTLVEAVVSLGIVVIMVGALSTRGRVWP